MCLAMRMGRPVCWPRSQKWPCFSYPYPSEASGRSADLQKELEALFNAQNTTGNAETTSIPATFLRVTVTR